MNELAFIRRVLSIVDRFDFHDCILWYCEEGKPVQFFVGCNDLFWWATADCQVVTPENVDELERAFVDAAAADDCCAYGPMLFCARMRGERPQGAAYPINFKDYQPRTAFWTLLDACGPERDVGPLNPYRPGERRPRGAA